MNKIRYAFVCLFIIVISGFTQNKGSVIFIDSVTVDSSQGSVTVPVNISAEELFSGYHATIRYNPKVLECTGIRTGSLISYFNILSNIETPGFIRAGGFDPSLKGVSGSGSLLSIEFEIKGKGFSALTLFGTKLSNKDGKDVPVKLVNGRITVEGDDEETAEEEDPTDTAVPQAITSTSAGISTAPSRETILRGRQGRAVSQSQSQTVSRTTTTKTQTPVTPPPEIPYKSTSENPLLYVRSEYGRPSPPCGMTSYPRGGSVKAEVEKEVIISEMEKVVCTGVKGEGSFQSGNTNKATFNIDKDTKIEWQWKKMPSERNFIIEFDSKSLEFKGEKVEIPLSFAHYGGLKSPIKIAVTKTPEFINAHFTKQELVYREGKNTLIIEKTPEGTLTAGRYKIELEAICEEIKKEYNIYVIITGEVKKSVSHQENVVLLTLKPGKNINSFGPFRLEIEFPDAHLKPERVEPESVRYKLLGKDILALAGTKQEREISVAFAVKKPCDNVRFDIRTFKILDKDGNSIPITITE
jgi:hypothetical protein